MQRPAQQSRSLRLCNKALGGSAGGGGFTLRATIGDLSVWLRMWECKCGGGSVCVCVSKRGDGFLCISSP